MVLKQHLLEFFIIYQKPYIEFVNLHALCVALLSARDKIQNVQ